MSRKGRAGLSTPANDVQDELNITMAQLNPTVGHIEANTAAIRKAMQDARKKGSDLVVTPELSITGYPTDDLTLRPDFLEQVHAAVANLAKDTQNGPALIVGAPWAQDGRIFNAAIVLENGAVSAVIRKRDLPQYGPFDDSRIFAPGPMTAPVTIRGCKTGILICEDMWTVRSALELKAQGAQILIALNASPFEDGKEDRRHDVARKCVRETGCPIVYVNQVGGQDELIFDGASFVMDHKGEITTRLPEWQEKIHHTSFDRMSGSKPPMPSYIDIAPRLDATGTVYTGLVMAIRDYARKNGFKSAVLGISGGADSALTTALAVDALGARNVHALMLPSGYTSQESHQDASFTARALGARYSSALNIGGPFEAIKGALKERWDQTNVRVTMENVQARLRMLMLFAVSNEEGHLVLNTSNKSEVAMGHSTFYGDTSGGYAPLMDVYKTRVFELAQWRNTHTSPIGKGPAGVMIAPNIFVKDPTPELSPNQTDRDLLPPYEVLDPIIKSLIEDEKSAAAIAAEGADRALVDTIARHIQTQQFKRYQMPPGPKVTKRSFGKRERRYPMTNGYKPAKGM